MKTPKWLKKLIKKHGPRGTFDDVLKDCNPETKNIPHPTEAEAKAFREKYDTPQDDLEAEPKDGDWEAMQNHLKYWKEQAKELNALRQSERAQDAEIERLRNEIFISGNRIIALENENRRLGEMLEFSEQMKRDLFWQGKGAVNIIRKRTGCLHRFDFCYDHALDMVVRSVVDNKPVSNWPDEPNPFPPGGIVSKVPESITGFTTTPSYPIEFEFVEDGRVVPGEALETSEPQYWFASWYVYPNNKTLGEAEFWNRVLNFHPLLLQEFWDYEYGGNMVLLSFYPITEERYKTHWENQWCQKTEGWPEFLEFWQSGAKGKPDEKPKINGTNLYDEEE